MFNWKMLLAMVLPMLESIGQAKVDEDLNETGKDDLTGQSLLYAVKVLKAISQGKTPPKAPTVLQ
ncbi:MAG: hypothetical protein ABIV21_02520 [Pyrinomonadaceae bacterium]